MPMSSRKTTRLSGGPSKSQRFRMVWRLSARAYRPVNGLLSMVNTGRRTARGSRWRRKHQEPPDERGKIRHQDAADGLARKSPMSISEPFIRRPIGTSLLMLGVLVFGIGAYNLLPVAALPKVDFPTIAVQVNYPGTSPDTMASAVA